LPQNGCDIVERKPDEYLIRLTTVVEIVHSFKFWEHRVEAKAMRPASPHFLQENAELALETGS
jgi:hypothetical protein